MQHSPQEIKTRLGEAVDPEGNVLNMAAVVEVIGLLERTPLTKEALEQTRIGRTVNLLRKKTENEDIARRAKKLVKRWQKLVQNHLEAVRNTNSPLNGLRCNSPIVNGSIKDEEKPGDESTVKSKQIDRINKGAKRKRSSSGTPPPCRENVNELSRTKKELDEEKKTEFDLSQDSILSSSHNSQDTEEAENNIKVENVSLDLAANDGTHLSKRLKQDEDETETVCGHESQEIMGDEVTVENTSDPTALSCDRKTDTLDHTDVRWKGEDFSSQTEDLFESETLAGQQNPTSLPLDTNDQVNGINGRFGEDGEWYVWSQAMPCNGGNLVVLPYVLLE